MFVVEEPMDIDMFVIEEPMDIDIDDTLPSYDSINQVEETVNVDVDEEPMDIDIVEEHTRGGNLVVVDDDNDERKNNIRSFLHTFFVDWKNGNLTTDILKSCKTIIEKKQLSSINISSWNCTDLTFERSLRQVCKEVFRYTYKLEYVISLLSFTIELDNHFEGKTWYETRWLIDILTMELIKTPFNPDNNNICMEEEEENKNSFSIFLSIIPVLLMAYFLYI